MTRNRFNMVFTKLAEAQAEVEAPGRADAQVAEASPQEIDELDELRRLVAEIAEPEHPSYTTT